MEGLYTHHSSILQHSATIEGLHTPQQHRTAQHYNGRPAHTPHQHPTAQRHNGRPAAHTPQWKACTPASYSTSILQRPQCTHHTRSYRHWKGCTHHTSILQHSATMEGLHNTPASYSTAPHWKGCTHHTSILQHSAAMEGLHTPQQHPTARTTLEGLHTTHQHPTARRRNGRPTHHTSTYSTAPHWKGCTHHTSILQHSAAPAHTTPASYSTAPQWKACTQHTSILQHNGRPAHTTPASYSTAPQWKAYNTPAQRPAMEGLHTPHQHPTA